MKVYEKFKLLLRNLPKLAPNFNANHDIIKQDLDNEIAFMDALFTDDVCSKRISDFIYMLYKQKKYGAIELLLDILSRYEEGGE